MFAQPAVGANPPFVTFRAGRLKARPIAGSTKLKMVGDPRKGTIALLRLADDLVHFQWRDRSNNDSVETDLMVFPDDATFVRMKTPKDEDRCYVLQFKSQPDRRFFFWMQEPDAERDEDLVQRLNDALKEPPSAAPAAPAGGLQGMLAQLAASSGGAANPRMQALQAAVAEMSPEEQASLQAQLMGRMGGAMGGAMGGGVGRRAAPGGASSGAAAAMPAGMGGMGGDEDMALQAALAASMQDFEAPAPAPAPASADAPAPAPADAPAPAPAPAPASGDATDADGDVDAAGDGAGGSGGDAPAAAGAAASGGITQDDFARAMAMIMGGGAEAAAPRPVPLSVVVDADKVLPHLDEALRARLRPLLPEGQQTDADLTEIVRSPQLQQALGSLTGALQTENVNAVFANFGLSPADGAEDLARGDGVAAFLSALQARADREAAASGAGEGAGTGEGSGGGDDTMGGDAA